MIDGRYPVSFTRRRYGSRNWFCWVDVYLENRWQSLGDPWNKFRPQDDEIRQVIEQRVRSLANRSE